MRTSYILFSFLLLFFQHTVAQKLTGIVQDESGNPLSSVNVSLPALHRGAVSDEQGLFSITNLSPGLYTVEFTLLGYRKETRNINIKNEGAEVVITLRQTALELPGVIITGKPQPSDVLSSSQSVSVVDGKELDRLRGQNLVQSLENTPGVSSYTTGSGISKPVIRGFTSQRILIISDGTRQEGQQWGDEHGPEIDVFDVDRIEVLRGASSILYGSDALGGVVNVISPDIPSKEEGYGTLGGKFTINGFSNNSQGAGNFSLTGTSGIFGYRGNLSMRNAGDIATPAGKLFNSGMKELNGGGSFGAKGSWGAALIDYSRFDQELQIHEDPFEHPDATPFQKVEHEKMHFHTDFRLSGIRFETDGSWQKNTRKEFEESDSDIPELHLNLNTYSLDIKGHHMPFGTVFGTVGFSLMHQINETLAKEKLIPGYRLLNVAGFVYEEAKLGRLSFSAGVRYDMRNMIIEETQEIDVLPQERNYQALTANAGMVFRISDPFALTLNLGRGWRAPSPFELFVDGVHKGTVQYLKGNKDLASERSLSLDFSLRYATNRIQSDLTLWQNDVTDYIYSSPTAETDSLEGLRIYDLSQADAVLTGAEFSLQAEVTNWLILSGGFDFIKGINEKSKNPLPLMPANRFRAGIKFFTPTMSFLSNPYFSITLKRVASQHRIEEFETATEGYTLIHAGLGGEIMAGFGRMNVDLGVENLFDVAYTDHLNRYKNYALNPGRNYSLKISVPFTIMQ